MDKNGYVYADNAATTRVCDEAVAAMMPYFGELYGNPSSIYSFASAPREALANARATIAKIINAEPDEIIFTSGGTESDNHAILGAAYENAARGKHIITTQIEHHAVLHTAKRLEKEGFTVTYLPVDSEGRVDPAALEAAITPETTLVTVMAANNEVGTIEPIAEIGKICRERKILFHTDAVQAVGHIEIDVKAMNIDMLSASAHKFNGPRGVGFLYIRRGSKVRRLIEGGGQERNRRSGTENIAGIVGMATALSYAHEHMAEEAARLSALRDKLMGEILKIPATSATGSLTHRLPGIVSVTVEGIEGESMVLLLDLNKIAASTGSACSTGSLDPSHVLIALGMKHEVAHGSLRLSLGRYSTEEDVEKIASTLPGIVERLRMMSPVWNN
ncbi:MAG: cysteine desulfurase NifS [Ruminococcaceae bacterium]|nr:cysteine desulfurase NifS [Oscillospiraceae bacterium]